MSEQPKIYPLSSVTKALENLIAKHANNFIWVKAEIVKLNYYKQSGHCYPDLVEKIDGKIVAEIRGNIWKDDFIEINKKFKKVLNEDLNNDMTIVCLAKVKYSSVYGISLNIIDINPEYTLGELAKQKAETIKRLKEEKLFYLNKSKKLPRIPKTIAIISVESSKGYRDFINVIENNSWGYKFHYKLFPAILQGTKSVTTITNQLNHIEKYKDIFDAVTIIRGGGGDIGLSSFDDYNLAREVATYSIPVLSGIGHSTNETVTELVSYKSFITPTKIAEFLIQEYHNFSVPLNDSVKIIENYVANLYSYNSNKIKDTARLFSSLTSNYLQNQKNILSNYTKSIVNNANIQLTQQKNTLKETVIEIKNNSLYLISNQNTSLKDVNKYLAIYNQNKIETELKSITNIEAKIKILSPSNILERGFSITRINGKSIKSINEVKKGDELITQVYDGKIISEIKK
ncbi:exodeoxyribonuclease VII large subunit [uncultured Lutibacter sp.]|uniref:exodeoxyribonuclease VII large subunit n=1 Tax=uncultured Lutibacter sp. TaxID=437739 RepID=UPI002621D850|nr:exodeoxyribonuclease VII large subunit [uncultured Lutibacter sp.]